MMQFKPFLGLWTTYRIENGVAITQTRSHRASIPLRNAKLETLDLDWPLGAIRIAAHGEELVWRKFRDRDRVMEALEAERQRAIQQDEPQRVQVNANRAKGDMDKIILAEGLDTGKAIYSITISDDGSKLAAGSEDRGGIWNLADVRLLSSINYRCSGALALNQERHSLAIARSYCSIGYALLPDEPPLREVDIFSGQQLSNKLEIKLDKLIIHVRASALSSNLGKYAYARYPDGAVDLYEISTGQLLRTINVVTNELNKIDDVFLQ